MGWSAEHARGAGKGGSGCRRGKRPHAGGRQVGTAAPALEGAAREMSTCGSPDGPSRHSTACVCSLHPLAFCRCSAGRGQPRHQAGEHPDRQRPRGQSAYHQAGRCVLYWHHRALHTHAAPRRAGPRRPRHRRPSVRCWSSLSRRLSTIKSLSPRRPQTLASPPVPRGWSGTRVPSVHRCTFRPRCWRSPAATPLTPRWEVPGQQGVGRLEAGQ